jgi:signal transduction histidine kinase
MAALRSMLKSLGNRPALALQLSCDGPELRYPARLETAAFRIAQEALNNALRHSACATLAIRVQTEPGRLALSITDDGCGFAVNTLAVHAFATHTFANNSDMARSTGTGTGTAGEGRPRRLGLAGMAERARSLGSELEIDSQPGRGTTVRVVLRVAAMPEAGES